MNEHNRGPPRRLVGHLGVGDGHVNCPFFAVTASISHVLFQRHAIRNGEPDFPPGTLVRPIHAFDQRRQFRVIERAITVGIQPIEILLQLVLRLRLLNQSVFVGIEISLQPGNTQLTGSQRAEQGARQQKTGRNTSQHGNSRKQDQQGINSTVIA